MRIKVKVFALSLLLATSLTATSAVAAARQAPDSGGRDLTPIERIVKAIKKHFPSIFSDGIQLPPPVHVLP